MLKKNVLVSLPNTLSLQYRVHCTLQGNEAKTGNSYPNDLLSQGNQGSLSSRVCRSQLFSSVLENGMQCSV